MVPYGAPSCFLCEGGHESAQGRLIRWPSSFVWHTFFFTEDREQVNGPGIGSGHCAGEHVSECEVNLVCGLVWQVRSGCVTWAGGGKGFG